MVDGAPARRKQHLQMSAGWSKVRAYGLWVGVRVYGFISGGGSDAGRRTGEAQAAPPDEVQVGLGLRFRLNSWLSSLHL
jgi:hypothetical protein